MGTDIHMVMQVRKDGIWKTIQKNVLGCNRSYDTFAVLADVRNGYGFAGIDTGDGFEPISEPKGLPDDVGEMYDSEHLKISKGTINKDDFYWVKEENREKYKKECFEETEYFIGDHSHSYLTLKEFMEYNTDRKTKHRGMVQEEEYLQMLEKGSNIPEGMYCNDVGGLEVVKLTPTQYNFMKKKNDLPKGTIYVKLEWESGYLDSTYIKELIEVMIEEKKKHELKSDEDIRLVFGFDS